MSLITYVDIETVPLIEKFEDLPEKTQHFFRKKFQWKADRDGISIEELYQKEVSFHAEFSKIVCLTVGILDISTIKIRNFYGNEELLLRNFCEMVDKLDQFCIKTKHRLQFCAHNGKSFDFPFISKRLMINGLSIPRSLDIRGLKPWEMPLIDTMELWRFGNFKGSTSIDFLCSLFKLPSPKGNLDGSKVAEAYFTGRLDEIVEYCQEDVVSLIRVHHKILGIPLDNDIEIVSRDVTDSNVDA